MNLYRIPVFLLALICLLSLPGCTGDTGSASAEIPVTTEAPSQAPTEVQPVEIPAIRGLRYNDARAQLEALGFTVEVQLAVDSEAAGDTILRTEPEAGTTVPAGSVVTVWVKKTICIDSVEVPDLVGMDIRWAQAQCEPLGLIVETEPVPSDAEPMQVLTQSIEPGIIVNAGETVVLTYAAVGTGTT
ncbi:MAG: PASTA domain-containing protein [Oscillospiraceae bacterium]|nr:PASTA domain-containing protein [Oscillospiraceae bacterium]